MIKNYTDKQLLVENWLTQMGFLVELEKSFGSFCVDIWLPEIDWVVEIDGPQHYQKEKDNRDVLLFAQGIKGITHVSVEIERERFEEIFADGIEGVFGNDKKWEKFNDEWNEVDEKGIK